MNSFKSTHSPAHSGRLIQDLPKLALSSAPKVQPTLSAVLSIIRWVAAFCVLIDHTRHFLLTELSNVLHANLGIKAFYFFTGFGHESVMVFFVISGYLVGGLSVKKWRSMGDIDVRGFCASRISRIYIVLFPSLILCYILDFCGKEYFDNLGLYTNPNHSIYPCIAGNPSLRHGIGTFLSNLFMLQGVHFEIFGSNTPLWSLAYEWWYYCLFLLVAIAISNHFSNVARILCALAGLTITAIMPYQLLFYGIIWCIGLIVSISAKRISINKGLAICLFFGTLVAMRLLHKTGAVQENYLLTWGKDLWLGISFGVFLLSLNSAKFEIPFANIHTKLSDFSYTTYLCHFPILFFVATLSHKIYGLEIVGQPTIIHIMATLVIAAIVFALCYLFSSVTERHTGKLRILILDLFAGSTIFRKTCAKSNRDSLHH